MNVKSAFSDGDLQKEVYMIQPLGLQVDSKEHKVFKLVKALYGLKQAPHVWYIKIDMYLIDREFQQSPDSNLCVKHASGEILIIDFYGDDLIISCSATCLVERAKQNVCQTFDMTN